MSGEGIMISDQGVLGCKKTGIMELGTEKTQGSWSWVLKKKGMGELGTEKNSDRGVGY